MCNVCIMGASFETGNQGVSALAASLAGLVRKVKPDASICFFIGSRQQGFGEVNISGEKIKYRVQNYRLSPRASLQDHLIWIFALACLQRILPSRGLRARITASNPCLKTLYEMDFVGDIHGGDSFSDIYGLKRLLFSVAIPDFIALLLGKKLVLFPQTYGPYRSSAAKAIARFIVKRAKYVLSRDEAGINQIRDLVGNAYGERIFFCPDVAFSMPPKSPSRVAISPPLSKGTSRPKIVGFNINGLVYHGGYNRNNMFELRYDYRSFVHKLARRILKVTNFDVLLVPHTFAPNGHVESDPAACKAVFVSIPDEFRERVHMVTEEYDQSEIKGIIGLCDFFIGSRMHACIAALSQSIPTIGIAYSQKFKGVFGSVGLDDMVLDARLLDEEKTMTRVLELLQDTRRHEELRDKVAKAKQVLENVFRQILSQDNGLTRGSIYPSRC